MIPDILWNVFAGILLCLGGYCGFRLIQMYKHEQQSKPGVKHD